MGERRAITRVLIANRGEIARRIIRTCATMGIETVAVYTDVDADAPYVREASASYPLGESTAYLSASKILSAAKATGADAIHPGYGFLSENPDFAEAVIDAGLIFIGPTPASIRALGSKTSAKELAKRASVPVSPTLIFSTASIGEHLRELGDFANSVGYPLIIKAAAGGGGRGMRLLSASSNAREELESAIREATKAFKSGEVFVERFIAPARHIEVQIAADRLGHVVALGTRDCSLQRSNQKIIEEAPAINLKPGVSEELCLAACRLAKEAGYSNLGTVEFLYSPDGFFYFLEVNTRLQVEHPVTELVTGLDLVRLQIELARGASLADCGVREAPSPRGHAIEARLCAEEYCGQFITGTGVVTDMEICAETSLPGIVRADMGVEPCSVVTHYYDSLLGKLIVHGRDRSAAIQLFIEALSRSRLSGVANNRSLLIHLARTEAFEALTHSIQGTSALLPSREEYLKNLCLAHAIIAAIRSITPRSTWARSSPWMSVGDHTNTAIAYPFTSATYSDEITSTTSVKGDVCVVAITSPVIREHHIKADLGRIMGPGITEYSLSIDESPAIQATLARDGSTTWVHLATGTSHATDTYSRRGGLNGDTGAGALTLTSSIPGRVATISVVVGQQVAAGDTLLVMDSMKMEHPLRAPTSGTVERVHVAEGAIVQAGAPLLTLHP